MNPILWLHHARPRSRWYELSAAKRETLLQEWRAFDDAAVEDGAERIGEYRVRGQGDWSTVSVWRFADVEAVLAHWHGRVRAGYSTWFAFSNSFGSDATVGRIPEVGT